MRTKALFVLSLGVLLLATTCSDLSPNCWGKCEDALFEYMGCATITGYLYVINDTLLIVNDVPSEFRTSRGDTMQVCIRYKEANLRAMFGDCPSWAKEKVNIRCIKKR